MAQLLSSPESRERYNDIERPVKTTHDAVLLHLNGACEKSKGQFFHSGKYSFRLL